MTRPEGETSGPLDWPDTDDDHYLAAGFEIDWIEPGWHMMTSENAELQAARHVAENAASHLVSSGVAARALGVNSATLWRWHKDGKVTPAFITAGGHLRWDVDAIRRQLSREASPTRHARGPRDV